MAVDIEFFDTSVLVAGLVDLGHASTAPRRALIAATSRRAARPHTAWHCCLEFYAVTTRLPEELRLSPEAALALLEENVLQRFTVKQLPDKAEAAFLREAARSKLGGGRIYDAHIAEIARFSGASLVVTENVRHFRSLERHGLRVVSASEYPGS